MSIETANAARFEKGLTVLTSLEGELLEALEALAHNYADIKDGESVNVDNARSVIQLANGETP